MSNIWYGLRFSSLGPGMSCLPTVGIQFGKQDRTIEYRGNKMYNNVFVFAAKREIMHHAWEQIQMVAPVVKRMIANKKRETVLLQRDLANKELIKNQEIANKDYGTVTTPEGYEIIAIDRYGEKVPEALMLYYDSEEQHKMEINTVTNGRVTDVKTINTTTYCFFDPTATVSANTAKNIVFTPVQGRDYTRKELIAGGDLKFTITGNIVGNDIDIYPTSEVKKFIQIAQYSGLIKVNHYLFDQFNVKQIIITDFSLSKSTCKNMQPYSLSCVAVEPDEQVMVTDDTISSINQIISASPEEETFVMILGNKLKQMAENSLTDIFGNAVGAGISAGLDNTIGKI
jgi:hypothetical protein